MKSVLIFLGGLITGIILIAGGGFIAMQYFSTMAEEYQAEWVPDFDEQLFKSAAELAAAKTEYERWVALGDVGLWNVDIGALDKATLYARESLKIAAKYKDNWNYGNAIYKGHLTLGRIALRQNNIDVAKKQLLLAGKTPGSPQLGSFGPNMILAKELLEAGEKETVLQFFELCEEFWDYHLEKLIKWEEQVENDETPYFGANLLY
ncbi:MAG: hypothetical protein KBT63_03360 [Porticoccaceae bacterium]|nr:hypothetical protein [Porticoccaceae bacterium]